MAGNTRVALFKEGKCLWLDLDKAPYYLQRAHDLEGFLSSRVSDPERVNTKLLKKVLALDKEDNSMVSLQFYGATITDNYWFKPRGSKKRYEDIAFRNDLYAEIALTGALGALPKHRYSSPQLTLGGSYEKCWKLMGEEWWMIKRGTPSERFSEYFVYLLGQAFHFPMAEYRLEDDVIYSRNFAKGLNYEPAKALVGDSDDYLLCFNLIYHLSPTLAQQYLRIIWMDSLVNNGDRHSENFGFLRSQKDASLVALAPNFDNNAALIAQGYPPSNNLEHDDLISFFEDLLRKSPQAKELYQTMKWPRLDQALLNSLYEKCSFKVDRGAISKYLLARYTILQNLHK